MRLIKAQLLVGIYSLNLVDGLLKLFDFLYSSLVLVKLQDAVVSLLLHRISARDSLGARPFLSLLFVEGLSTSFHSIFN